MKFYWSLLTTILRLQLWFHFHPNSDQHERLKATHWGRLGEPDPWPPTLWWPKKSTRTGWDMRRRWTTPTAPPTNSREYLLVRHSQAGAWPAPTCGGFRLGGGSPTGEHERLQSGKRGKKKKSIHQTTQQVQTSQPASGFCSCLCSDLNRSWCIRPVLHLWMLIIRWNMSTSHWRMFAFIHASAKNWNPNRSTHWHVSPPCSSMLWWLAENSQGHYGWLHIYHAQSRKQSHVTRSICSGNKEPVYWLLRIQTEYWSPGTATRSNNQVTFTPMWPKPGSWTAESTGLKNQDEQAQSGSGKAPQTTNGLDQTGENEQTGRRKTFWKSFSDTSFLNSDVFLFGLPQSEKRDASLRKSRLGFAWREETNG